MGIKAGQPESQSCHHYSLSKRRRIAIVCPWGDFSPSNETRICYGAIQISITLQPCSNKGDLFSGWIHLTIWWQLCVFCYNRSITAYNSIHVSVVSDCYQDTRSLRTHNHNPWFITYIQKAQAVVICRGVLTFFGQHQIFAMIQHFIVFVKKDSDSREILIIERMWNTAPKTFDRKMIKCW